MDELGDTDRSILIPCSYRAVIVAKNSADRRRGFPLREDQAPSHQIGAEHHCRKYLNVSRVSAVTIRRHPARPAGARSRAARRLARRVVTLVSTGRCGTPCNRLRCMTPSRNLTARAFRAAVRMVRIHLPPAKSRPRTSPQSSKFPRETDSLAEGNGFEPSVPRQIRSYF
jgi:hypothetical protein